MNDQLAIGIVGVGKMGEALLRGWLSRDLVPASHIFVSDSYPGRARDVAARHGVRSVPTNAKLAERSDILILAAKPKDMSGVIRSIADHVRPDALVVTLAAGVRTAFVEKALNGRGHVVRIMPNLACAVGEGATAYALGATSGSREALALERIMGAVGHVTRVDEPLLDAVTGLSGSGPGFLAGLSAAMIEGGIRAGLSPEDAKNLVLQTMKGTATLLLQDNLAPEELYAMVATPSGTTAAGWNVMAARGVPAAIRDGIVAAASRAAELAEEVARTTQ